MVVGHAKASGKILGRRITTQATRQVKLCATGMNPWHDVRRLRFHCSRMLTCSWGTCASTAAGPLAVMSTLWGPCSTSAVRPG